MTSIQLFFNRWKEGIVYQYNVVKTVADWTIQLYLIIPSLFIGALIYRSWWMETPAWIEEIPIMTFFFIPFFWIWFGNVRIYIQRADFIFLLKHRKLFEGLKKWGVVTSFIMQSIIQLLVVGLLSPFWFLHYNLSLSQFFLFAMIVVSAKWVVLAIKPIIFMQSSLWKKVLCSCITLWGLSLYWLLSFRLVLITSLLPIIISVLLLIISGLLLVHFKVGHRYHHYNLLFEEKQKVKWINLIFMTSQDIDVPVKTPKKKKPWFAKVSLKSKRTSLTSLLEMFGKVLIRNFSHSALYMQAIGLSVAAQFIIPPLWLKLFVMGVVYIAVLIWNDQLWNQFITKHPLGGKYKEKEVFFKAKKFTLSVACLPLVIELLIILVLII
ncbi:ABC transporter permease [Bacillus seohaeanensis]|uniref:ABC transporter permease n=1 Tax=Bacillus seohaeanensis TaxID=284580 RepID=A0ABW5RU27_9BACI